MKINEIREQTKEELETKLTEIKKNLFNLKFQKATGQLENLIKIRNLRKDIARVETLLREKELNEKNKEETGTRNNKKTGKIGIKK